VRVSCLPTLGASRVYIVRTKKPGRWVAIGIVAFVQDWSELNWNENLFNCNTVIASVGTAVFGQNPADTHGRAG
jgi:hypothetical protein